MFSQDRACLKIHSHHLHAPLRGRFGPNSLNVARYAALIWAKSTTKWDAQLTESNFQTHPRPEGADRMRKFYEVVEANPVIAAVKDEEGLEMCCSMEEMKVIFVLFGDICSIPGIVKRIKDAGKTALVHIDLITGLSAKEAAVDYIKSSTSADGILSTKPLMIQRAKELSMYTVLRFFVIDSMAIKSIEILDRQRGGKPDFIEVMPGVMPKVISRICRSSRIPVIAGGLIADKEDVMGALEAGAMAVSSTDQSVWEL